MVSRSIFNGGSETVMLVDRAVALPQDVSIEIDLLTDLPASGDLHLELRWTPGVAAQEAVCEARFTLETIQRRVAQAARPTDSTQSVNVEIYRAQGSTSTISDYGHARVLVWRSTDPRKLYLACSHVNFDSGVLIWARVP